MDKILEKLKQELPGVEGNVVLKNYTTYKIGGPAKYFFVVKTTEDLIKAIKAVKQFKLPYFILGGGSNLLISDKGFKGIVIKIDILGVELAGTKLIVGAGEKLAKLSYCAADVGLSGLEWSTGIPGAAIGGSIYGHAQGFGTKISSVVESVWALDSHNLKLKNYTNKVFN